jgi:hypothetical protein
VADDSPPLQQDAARQPIVLPTSSGTVLGVQPVIVELVWGVPSVALSQGGEGVVTSVGVTDGSVLRNGGQIATVAGSPIFALVAPEPMYRPLAIGDEGPDVGALFEVLTDMGYLDAGILRSQQVGQDLSDAIAAFNESSGRRQFRYDSRGRVVGPEFDYRNLVWLGPDEMVIGAVGVQPGRPWPAAGEVVLSSEPTLISASVSAAREDGSVVLVDETYILEIEDLEMSLTDSGDVAGSSLIQLAESLRGQEADQVIPGTIRLASPSPATKIAPSAIVSDGSTLCVFVPQGDGGFGPVAVTVLDSSFGVTLIVPNLDIDEVVANPQQVLGQASCSS